MNLDTGTCTGNESTTQICKLSCTPGLYMYGNLDVICQPNGFYSLPVGQCQSKIFAIFSYPVIKNILFCVFSIHTKDRNQNNHGILCYKMKLWINTKNIY